MATDSDAGRSERDAQAAFAHRVNHALRGDIQALRQSLEAATVLADALGSQDALRAAFAGIERSLDRLERRALDIALLTLAGAGEIEARLQRQPLKVVAEAAARAARPRAARLKLRLVCDVSDCGSARARIDYDLMLRALEALLDNAMRFSPPRGTITLTVTRDGEMRRFTVRDQGAGFAPGEGARVFAPFVVGANEQSEDGLGLGLAVAQVIAEAHRGHVHLVKDGAPGAAVAIELPRA